MGNLKIINWRWNPGDIIVLEIKDGIQTWKRLSFDEYNGYKNTVDPDTFVKPLIIMEVDKYSYGTAIHLSSVFSTDEELEGSFTGEKPVVNKYVEIPKINPDAEYETWDLKGNLIRKCLGKDLEEYKK